MLSWLINLLLLPRRVEWNFQANLLMDDWHISWNCPEMNVIGTYLWYVHIDSGNGLVPSGNKLLPEPDLCCHMASPGHNELTCWGQVTHICVCNLTIISSDNGLSPGRRQAITWTNVGILWIVPLGTNFSEMSIEIHTFSFNKIQLKMLSGKWRPFCLGLNVLMASLHGTQWCSEAVFDSLIVMNRHKHWMPVKSSS